MGMATLRHTKPVEKARFMTCKKKKNLEAYVPASVCISVMFTVCLSSFWPSCRSSIYVVSSCIDQLLFYLACKNIFTYNSKDFFYYLFRGHILVCDQG